MIAVKLFDRAYSKHYGVNLLLLGLAVLYALIMINLLYFRDRSIHDGLVFNWTPFDTIKRYVKYRDHFTMEAWVKNLFGNLVLFIPIGIFLPLLNTRFARSLSLVAVCIVIIFFVEMLQMLFKVGSFDIDDILLNTIGAWFGLLLTRRLLMKKRR
ncbi:VanZ family protein [Paenibacillus sp. HB172176]|uniref:VanZ family protein n=1 Tax=Paenibacillus sp. HB172176 TaxID=2493690 RepID=UPI001439672A|nr:VanZ family protein [Paenibacillus sp. HB172176]